MTNDEIKKLLREVVRETNVADFVQEARKRDRKVAIPTPPAAVHIVGVFGGCNHIEINVSGHSDDLLAPATD